MSDKALWDVTVADVKRLPGDAIAIALESSADAKPLPAFDAGAHVDVHLRNGLVRQYSLCNAPSEKGVYRLGVLRDTQSRGGSVELFDMLRVGDQLSISAPRNLFPLIETARYSVLVGGGIGVTPLMAMAHHLHASEKAFELRYCVTTPEKASFFDALERAPFAERVIAHFDKTEPSQAFDPKGDLPPARKGAHIYVCGPSGFMDWVLGEARALGYAAENLHKEDFGAEVDRSGDAFEVEARLSGVTLSVGDGQSIVDALAKAGIDVDVSCEEGVCGTCLCNVLDGEPDHRDSFLTEEERAANDVILPCCSRSKTPKLVLEI